MTISETIDAFSARFAYMVDIQSRESPMAHSATIIANRFLELAAQAGKTLTPLQLIKLCYMAYGWNLEISGQRLFEEQPQAWQYGPVIPSVYHKVKQYRDQPIAGRLPVTDWFGNPTPLSPEEDRLLQSVFNSYGSFSGIQLSTMTHQAGTPWYQVWHTAGRNAPIPDDIIRQHYQEIRRTRAA
jgi:uncharacterized phage-associated protein